MLSISDVLIQMNPDNKKAASIDSKEILKLHFTSQVSIQTSAGPQCLHQTPQ